MFTGKNWFLLVVLCAVGCASQSRRMELTAEEKALLLVPASLDLFSARGFLGGSDYERYVLKENVLWRECGTVEKGQSQTLSNSAGLALQERRVEVLTPEQGVLVRKRLEELMREKPAKLTPPGSVHALSGPGLFEADIQLGGQRDHVVTSIDSVADEENGGTKAARALFSAVRGIGPVICDAPTFFGIQRHDPTSLRG